MNNSASARRADKTALVLAGGGLTGAVYEIGALRAIDDLLVDRSVQDFDIIVGTSAGALVGSFLANGFGPDLMLQVLNGEHPDVPHIRRKDILRLNHKDLLRQALQAPQTLIHTWNHFARHTDDLSLFDVLWFLSESLPSGLYDGMSLEQYVRTVMTTLGCCNCFDDLEKQLYIIATDLDDGNRVVFGKGYRHEVPISLAVAASTALPLVYKPVRIGEHEYIDGGMRGTASLDVAIEHGAKLIICINPLVPYDNSDHKSIPLPGSNGKFLSEKGMQVVFSQTSRILMQAGLHYHIKQLRRSHPDVDIILIEPRSDDYEMFYPNIMRYSQRIKLAQHGFEAVTVELAQDYAKYKNILARHDIPLTRRLVIEELNEIRQSDYDPQVIQRVLESQAARRPPPRQDSPIRQLDRTLAELEMALEALSPHMPQMEEAEP